MKNRMRQQLASKLSGSIRRAILSPVLLLSGAAIAAFFVTGINIYLVTKREAQTLDLFLLIADRSHDLVEELLVAQNFVRAEYSGLTVITSDERAQELAAMNTTIESGLTALYWQSEGSPHEPVVTELIEAHRSWAERARALLEIENNLIAPSLIETEQLASNAMELAEGLVRAMKSESAVAIEQANATVLRSLRLGGLFALVVFGVVSVLAWRMSARISRVMIHVSNTLRKLSHIETPKQGTTQHELISMIEALDVLETSIRDKARMAKQLQQEKQRAEEAAQTKARFLANMSHEIRTPINGVLGMAEILGETQLNPDQRECAHTILKSSEALLTVINDILDFSKNETGEVLLQAETFCFYDAVFDVAGLLGPAMGGRDVEVCVDYPRSVSHWIEGDEGRIRQILMNLVGNSVKFTSDGHVTIAVRSELDRLIVSVTDTGIGIPQDKLSHIFGAFHQADMQVSRRFEGTGLGLAITRQLVEQMQGEISVTSTEGQGSTFTVNLPLIAKSPPRHSSHPIWSDFSNFAGRHVLVVDDLDDVVAGLKQTLTGWNMIVHTCKSAQEVLALPSDLLADLDLAIIDDGLEDLALVEQMWRSQKSALCAVILHTTNARETEEVLPFQDAMHLIKPAREDSLAGRLHAAWGQTSPPKQQNEGPSVAKSDLAGLRVLVAEDNKTNRLVLGKLLKSTGVDISFCENGQEAVDHFKSHGADVILMDMAMPVLDGIGATEAIRTYEQANDRVACPIIALTANAMPADRKICEEAGMSDFLTKPVRKAELVAALRKQAQPEPTRDAG
jgi:signal transduction histidine kinase/DNA-binding response OmpR family regulator